MFDQENLLEKVYLNFDPENVFVRLVDSQSYTWNGNHTSFLSSENYGKFEITFKEEENGSQKITNIILLPSARQSREPNILHIFNDG